MEEEMKDEELEDITRKVEERLNERYKGLSEIARKQGVTISGGKKEISFPGEFYKKDDKNYFKFYNNYRSLLSSKDIDRIINILKEGGYEVEFS